MNAPQIVMIVLLALAAFRGIIKHGESDGTVNAGTSMLGVAINVALLWWGGFWA